MGSLSKWSLLSILLMNLMGCPHKDWLKREDDYLTVEQYRTMTKVVSINDTLYRVKKGEEINQNNISQLFYQLNNYVNTPRSEQKTLLEKTRKNYEADKSILNVLSYAMILLERKEKEDTVLNVLAAIDHTQIKLEDSDLVNLAQILHDILTLNKGLKKENVRLSQQAESASEQVTQLTQQINALKSIEENIHAREVGIELENR